MLMFITKIHIYYFYSFDLTLNIKHKTNFYPQRNKKKIVKKIIIRKLPRKV